MRLQASVVLAFSVAAVSICYADAPRPDAQSIHRAFEEKDRTINALREEVSELKKSLSARDFAAQPTPPTRLNKDDGADPPQARAVAWRIRTGETVGELEAELGPPTTIGGNAAEGIWSYATADGWATAGFVGSKVVTAGFAPIFPNAGAYPRAQMWFATRKGATVLDR